MDIASGFPTAVKALTADLSWGPVMSPPVPELATQLSVVKLPAPLDSDIDVETVLREVGTRDVLEDILCGTAAALTLYLQFGNGITRLRLQLPADANPDLFAAMRVAIRECGCNAVFAISLVTPETLAGGTMSAPAAGAAARIAGYMGFSYEAFGCAPRYSWSPLHLGSSVVGVNPAETRNTVKAPKFLFSFYDDIPVRRGNTRAVLATAARMTGEIDRVPRRRIADLVAKTWATSPI